MDVPLHHEFDVTVVAVRPWGLEVEFQDGTPGLIDNTKDPAWPSGDRVSVVGTALHVVVIDDQRDPVRLSALSVDFEIARTKRSATSG
ncbi:hypothetical protein [Kitasatospora griseola]|uniref:hypothetical protein n=1 Tax=Kitasatospora griseola TaxID=2064 RepID=UPI0016702CBD|nr:hypothetical protein [Kitasatospora griseola]